TTTLSGLAVIFDDEAGLARDFEGDFFTAKTYLSPRIARGEEDEFEATFHHGIATRPEFKGLASHEFTHPVKAKPTAEGLLVSLILEERDEYEREVAEAGKAGALGWSIGSAGHRARKTKLSDGRNRIDRYPIVEIATTHRPMEPRTFAVPLKALLPGPALKAEGESHNAFIRRVEEALRSQFGGPNVYLWPVDVYDAFAVVEENGTFWRAPFEDGAGGVRFAGRAEWAQVERVVSYDPVLKALRAARAEMAGANDLTHALRDLRRAIAA
ncbi:MAG TPA: hypothetical protein VD838_03190, partial [Anaeromyxobacteraceae bacterium]|nr:hypothetical protein [Anaeromyxobacteraceae bacterium]